MTRTRLLMAAPSRLSRIRCSSNREALKRLQMMLQVDWISDQKHVHLGLRDTPNSRSTPILESVTGTPGGPLGCVSKPDTHPSLISTPPRPFSLISCPGTAERYRLARETTSIPRTPRYMSEEHIDLLRERKPLTAAEEYFTINYFLKYLDSFLNALTEKTRSKHDATALARKDIDYTLGVIAAKVHTVAVFYYRRFFLTGSIHDYNPPYIVAACILLANKITGVPRSWDWHLPSFLACTFAPLLDATDKDLEAAITETEIWVYQRLGFDLYTDNIYSSIVRLTIRLVANIRLGEEEGSMNRTQVGHSFQSSCCVSHPMSRNDDVAESSSLVQEPHDDPVPSLLTNASINPHQSSSLKVIGSSPPATTYPDAIDSIQVSRIPAIKASPIEPSLFSGQEPELLDESGDQPPPLFVGSAALHTDSDMHASELLTRTSSAVTATTSPNLPRTTPINSLLSPPLPRPQSLTLRSRRVKGGHSNSRSTSQRIVSVVSSVSVRFKHEPYNRLNLHIRSSHARDPSPSDSRGPKDSTILRPTTSLDLPMLSTPPDVHPRAPILPVPKDMVLEVSASTGDGVGVVQGFESFSDETNQAGEGQKVPCKAPTDSCLGSGIVEVNTLRSPYRTSKPRLGACRTGRRKNHRQHHCTSGSVLPHEATRPYGEVWVSMPRIPTRVVTLFEQHGDRRMRSKSHFFSTSKRLATMRSLSSHVTSETTLTACGDAFNGVGDEAGLNRVMNILSDENEIRPFCSSTSDDNKSLINKDILENNLQLRTSGSILTDPPTCLPEPMVQVPLNLEVLDMGVSSLLKPTVSSPDISRLLALNYTELVDVLVSTPELFRVMEERLHCNHYPDIYKVCQYQLSLYLAGLSQFGSQEERWLVNLCTQNVSSFITCLSSITSQLLYHFRYSDIFLLFGATDLALFVVAEALLLIFNVMIPSVAKYLLTTSTSEGIGSGTGAGTGTTDSQVSETHRSGKLPDELAPFVDLKVSRSSVYEILGQYYRSEGATAYGFGVTQQTICMMDDGTIGKQDLSAANLCRDILQVTCFDGKSYPDDQFMEDWQEGYALRIGDFARAIFSPLHTALSAPESVETYNLSEYNQYLAQVFERVTKDVVPRLKHCQLMVRQPGTFFQQIRTTQKQCDYEDDRKRYNRLRDERGQATPRSAQGIAQQMDTILTHWNAQDSEMDDSAYAE